jgi:hypothetical protein
LSSSVHHHHHHSLVTLSSTLYSLVAEKVLQKELPKTYPKLRLKICSVYYPELTLSSLIFAAVNYCLDLFSPSSNLSCLLGEPVFSSSLPRTISNGFLLYLSLLVAVLRPFIWQVFASSCGYRCDMHCVVLASYFKSLLLFCNYGTQK